jgi:Clr5 domain
MPPAQGIPGAQRVERADRVPDAIWEDHRGTIERLYISMKLEDLIIHMEENYGFSARQVPN